MLKLLYKTLLVSVMSGSLMLTNFNYAYAESVKTGIEDKSDIGSTLTMTIVGTLSSRLYTYKPTIDVMLAAAGGAIFLGGEVLAYLKLKESLKTLETQIVRDQNGSISKEQVDILERLKKSYQDAKGTAQTKKTLQLAAAAAFAAAGVAAYTMHAGDMAALTTCSSGITGALTMISGPVMAQCKALIAGQYTAPEGHRCAAEVNACKASMTGYQKGLMSYEMARQAAGPSAAALATVSAREGALTGQLQALSGSCVSYTSAGKTALQSACRPLVPNNIKGETGGTGLLTVQNSIKSFPLLPQVDEKKVAANYIVQFFDLIFPAAHAELFSAMGIASSAAISYLMLTSATLGPTIDLFMLIPQKRAIAWGVLSGLTFMATTATDNVIKKIDEDIDKIDKILNELYKLANGTPTTQIIPVNPGGVVKVNGQLNGINAVNYNDISLNNNGSNTLPCATGDKKPCKTFESSLADLPSYSGLDAQSQLQLNGILKTASGFSGTSTISKGSLEGAAKLAGSANALRTALSNAQKNANEELKKSGSQINLEAEQKKLSDALAKGVNDNLLKSKSTPEAMMASLYGGRSGASASAVSPTAPSDDAKKLTDEALKKGKVTAAEVVDLNAGTEIGNNNLGLGTGLEGAGAQPTTTELAAYNEATKGLSSIDEYDLKNDISKDPSSSIFELISNRYQKSGYPRLFKLKEVSTPVNK